ncbi:MAG TPA: phosphopentomutase [Deltaproteobacteria bacterium]|nr:phosphopentomutase [Deltaproteobacteria bacterium]
MVTVDGLGIGALPDASCYGDEGSHTFDNTARAVGGIGAANLEALGLGNIEGVDALGRVGRPLGCYGRMAEASRGKDTSTGHWEIAGVVTDRPPPTFPHGFPGEMMERFERITGLGWLGNRPASGTEIIEELGREHLATGRPIVYTSADSVFQVAAHVDVMAPERLYELCRSVRPLADDYGVARVIARPFTGRPGSFTRLPIRKDFSMAPPRPTLLDAVKEAGLDVMAVGKIGDIFAHRGTSAEYPTKSDAEGIERTVEVMAAVERGLVFTNLVDLDTLYGHRNDPRGYAAALEAVDAGLAEITSRLRGDDMLVVTADHGCDPTTPSTDHSREYVPLLVHGPALRRGVDLGTRESFADVAATAAAALGVAPPDRGVSFLDEIVPPREIRTSVDTD